MSSSKMSEKQRACIEWICDTLDVTYWGSDSSYDAWKFINKFIDRAREVQLEQFIYNGGYSLRFFFGTR